MEKSYWPHPNIHRNNVWHKRSCKVYRDVALAHLTGMTQTSSINSLGSEMSRWSGLRNLARPQVESWWESRSNSQTQRSFARLRLNSCFSVGGAAEKLDALETEHSFKSGWIFHQIKAKERLWPSTFGGQREPSQVSAVRRRPSVALRCEREGKTKMWAGLTQSPHESWGLILFQTSWA